MGIDFNDMPDLSFGLQRYTAAKKDLEGVIERISTLFNVSNYIDKLNDIDTRATNEIAYSPKMPFEGMQLDSEGFMFDKYINELKLLKEEIERKYLIYYKISLLTNNLEKTLNQEIKLDNIGGFIDDAITLIDNINEIVSNNILDETSNNLIADQIVNKAYYIVYKVLKYEELFERHDIFEYISKEGLKVNKETISRLITKDIRDNNINIEELLRSIELDNIDNEGLGLDYFRLDVIKEISRLTVGKVNKEYQARRQEAINYLVEKANSISRINKSLTNQKAENNAIIRKEQIASLIVAGWLVLSSSLPLSLGFGGYKWGKSKSDKIDLYQTTTCTRDLTTSNIIGDKEIIFDEVETTYVATIKECGPWRNNPTGNGFIREIVTYEYITPEDVEEGHRITEYKVGENAIKKYTYSEMKEKLDAADSKTDTVILITETYQDKNVTEKSKKYIIPFTLLGSVVGIAATIALNLCTNLGFDGATRELERLSESINAYKADNQQINKRIQSLVQESEQLMQKKKDVEYNFGSIKDEFIITNYDIKEDFYNINNNNINIKPDKEHKVRIKRIRQ